MENNLNLNNLKYYKNPFPHVIINNPFPHTNVIEEDFPSKDTFSKNSFRMNGDMTYPEENYINLISTSKVYNNLHNYIYSKEFIVDFLNLFRNEIINLYKDGQLIYDPFKLPIIACPYETTPFDFSRDDLNKPFLYPRFDLGYGVKGYGLTNGGAGIHTDNWGRLISILYYVNQPIDMIGGEHRMYEIKNQKPLLSKNFRPEKGLLISSLQTNKALHDVKPVDKIKGSRNAFYLAISCNKKIWNKGDNWLMALTSNRKNNPNKNLVKKVLDFKISKFFGKLKN